MSNNPNLPDEISFADDPVNRDLSPDDKLDLLRQMVRIRRFEQVALTQYQEDKMGGFLHLYIGQESVSTGTMSLLGKDDHVITAYRDHGHALCAGMTMNECMAELFGKRTGCSKGKGGSMHFFDPEKNYWGGHGIVAGQTPLGCGLAYAVKYLEKKGSCLCYLGDGAVNQGAFHEALNLASLWDLPAIYVIENNGYSMGTSQERSSAHPAAGLAARAEGYGMKWDQINGVCLYEIRAKTKRALDRTHQESRPTLLEIFTYRHKGHSIADANADKYRTKEEIQRYMHDHDPITNWKDVLIDEGVVTEDSYKAMMKEASKEAREAVEFAEASPYPDVSEITDDVYWEVDNNTEAGRTGRHFFH